MYPETIDQLIGKKITQIFVSPEDFLFIADDGKGYHATLYADCCSSSYFYDFYGVKNLLHNGPITEIKTVDIVPTDITTEDYQEKDLTSADSSIQVYGYQITTEHKEWGPVTSVFSFRNYSNGYYGGDIYSVIEIEAGETLEKLKAKLTELTDDTSHIDIITNKPN